MIKNCYTWVTFLLTMVPPVHVAFLGEAKSSPKREKTLLEITTVKEEMSHAFNVLFTSKEKCCIRIAEPWYAATKTELAH